MKIVHQFFCRMHKINDLINLLTNGVHVDSNQSLSFNMINLKIIETFVTQTTRWNFVVVGGDHGNVELLVSQSARRCG